MSEKAGMGKSKTISVYIQNNMDINEPKVKVTINSDATVFDLTKNVAKEFWKFNEENNGYYKEFRLVWNHQPLNTSKFKNQKIDLLDQPITDNKTIGINFDSTSNNDVFSWDTLSEKDKEGAEKIVSVSKISAEADLKKQTKINLNTDKKGQKRSSEEEKKSVGHESSWPAPRIIVGVIDLLLFAAAVAAFLLGISIVVTIILFFLFLVGGVLFLGWSCILPKILSESLLQRLGGKTNVRQNNEDRTQKVFPKQEHKKYKIK